MAEMARGLEPQCEPGRGPKPGLQWSPFNLSGGVKEPGSIPYRPQLLHYCYYDTRHSTLAAADAVLPDGGHGVHGDVRCDVASGCGPARGAPAP